MATSIRRFRIFLWALVVVAALGATGMYFFAGVKPGLASLGSGEYQLATAQGEPFTKDTLKGHPSMVFFGFTHCPEVCPTTMAEMAQWFEELGDEAGDLRAYFVSVDPERDTPAVIGDYVAWTGHVTGVTGSRSETDKAIKNWGVVAQKVMLENGDYNMDHTASVFLMNRQGEFEGTIAYREDSAAALAKLRRLVDRPA